MKPCLALLPLSLSRVPHVALGELDAAFDIENDGEDTLKIPDLAWLTDVSDKSPEPKAKRERKPREAVVKVTRKARRRAD